MVSIAKDDLGPNGLYLRGSQGFHRGLGADWHKNRCFKTAMGCF